MQATRPPFLPSQPPAGWALFFVVAALCVGSQVAWFVLRDEPWLAKGRSFGVSLFANAGLIIGAASFLLRLALFSPENNSTTMPCLAVAIMCMLGVGMAAVSACLRIFVLYARTLHSHLILKMQEDRVGDDQQSSVSGPSTKSSPLSAVVRSFSSVWMSLVSILVSEEWQMIKKRKTNPTAVAGGSHESSHKSLARTMTAVGVVVDLSEVRQTSTAMSSAGLALLGCIGLISLAIVIIPVILTNPLYTSGCVGCDIYLGPLIACLVMGFNAFAFLSYLFWLMRGSSWDEYGVKWELMLWVVTTPSIYLLVSILLIIDPGGYGTSNVFSWDWLSTIPLFTFIAVWDIYPLVVAYLDRNQRNDTVQVITEAQIQEGIFAALSDPRFESLCERLFVVELLRFLKEEKSFVDNFFEKSELWRKAKAKNIDSRYIANLSPMQVNIGADLRREIEVDLTMSKLDIDIFAKARLEVLKLIKPAYLKYLDAQKRSKSVVAASAPGLTGNASY